MCRHWHWFGVRDCQAQHVSVGLASNCSFFSGLTLLVWPGIQSCQTQHVRVDAVSNALHLSILTLRIGCTWAFYDARVQGASLDTLTAIPLVCKRHIEFRKSTVTCLFQERVSPVYSDGTCGTCCCNFRLVRPRWVYTWVRHISRSVVLHCNTNITSME